MWRFRNNNRLINEKEKLELHKMQLERLLQVRSNISNLGPPLPFFLKNKLSKKEALKEKEQKRVYENSIIYSRLLSINNKPSPYSKFNAPIYCPAFDKKRFHYDKKQKAEELSKRNTYYYKRFTKEKPHYSAKNQLEVNIYENYLKNNILKQHIDNPNIFFCTYEDFKENLKKQGLRRCKSARKIKKNNDVKNYSNCSYYNNNYSSVFGISKNGKLNRNNSCGYFSCYVDNKNDGKGKNKIVNFNSANNNNNSTGISSGMSSNTPLTFSRCQSAIDNRKKIGAI